MNSSGTTLMRKLKLRHAIRVRILLVSALCPLVSALGGENNQPLEVAIIWPRNGDEFAAGIGIKIKADASSNAGASVTQVQFFAETDLIGTVTNAPFNLVWQGYFPRIYRG